RSKQGGAFFFTCMKKELASSPESATIETCCAVILQFTNDEYSRTILSLRGVRFFVCAAGAASDSFCCRD
ncbi:hypothetical protein VU06_02450, partial [Desulfobulbus sp. F3]|nr:hypothetical protein [Desulfobulbus sp. F3]